MMSGDPLSVSKLLMSVCIAPQLVESTVHAETSCGGIGTGTLKLFDVVGLGLHKSTIN